MKRKNDHDRRLARIYAVTQHGGRRMSAVAFDAVLLLAALFFVLCVVFRPHTQSRIVSRAAALVCTLLSGAVWLITDMALRRRHIARLRRKAAVEAAEAKLMLRPDALYERISVSSDTAVIAKIDLLTADDIAAAVKHGTPVTLICSAKPTEKAKELLSMLEGEVSVIDAREAAGVSAQDLFPVTEAEIDARLLRKYSRLIRRPGFGKGLFALAKERGAKYLASGAALLAMSFFMRYPLYYRMIGSALLSVGSWFFVWEKLRSAKEKEPA